VDILSVPRPTPDSSPLPSTRAVGSPLSSQQHVLAALDEAYDLLIGIGRRALAEERQVAEQAQPFSPGVGRLPWSARGGSAG
jgi:hypothetical protein